MIAVIPLYWPGGCTLDIVATSPTRFLSALFEEHQEPLVRFLTLRLGNAEDAAEIAQEAYLRLMKVERLEELENPRGYLFRTAANLAIDRTRQQSRFALVDQHFQNIEEALRGRRTLGEAVQAFAELGVT